MIEETHNGWLLDVLMTVGAAVSTLIMALVGLVWKSQNRKIDDLNAAFVVDKAARIVEIREIRDDVETKHAENRQDIRLVHIRIEENDRRAQDRHNDLMEYLRDHPRGGGMKERR